jgi:hypothetical protein
MRRRRITVAAGLAAAFLVTTPAHAAGVASNQRVADAAGKYWAAHPGDFIGLETAIRRAGSDKVSFMAEGTRGRSVSGLEAQKLYNRAQRRVASGRPLARASAIPVDAFRVWSAWWHVQDYDGEWWSFSGYWDFKDAYIGSGAPDNASGVAVAGMNYSCWNVDGSSFYMNMYNGTNTASRGYLKGADRDSSVYGIRDGASGFASYHDHGQHVLHFRRIASGCSTANPYGRYYYEHNQDGSGGWGFSIDIKIFSLSYTSSGGQKLKKATEVDYQR